MEWVRVPLLVMVLSSLIGCDNPLGPRLTWRRVGDAALEAATSPLVWGPAAGAAVFQIDDWDHRASDWATKNTPVFGSIEDAQDASDILKDASHVTYGVLAVATPTGEDGTYSLENKVWELGLGVGAIGVTSFATTTLKDVTDRQRPDKRSDNSFPSAHASTSAVSATLSLRYVDYYDLPDWGDAVAKGALIALPYATGYARVEGKRHFPSDVLAGIALGNFFGLFVNELLDPEEEDETELYIAPTGDGVVVGLRIEF